MDTGPPSQQPDNSIRFDISYAKTIPGLLKAAVVGCSFLGLICNSSYKWGAALAGWYNFTAVTAMITSLVLLILYLVRVPWALQIIVWYLSELIYCAIFCFFFAISSIGTLITIATQQTDIAAKIFAALFGALAAGSLGYDALLKLMAHRRGEVGPGVVRPTVSASGQV